MYNLYKSGNIRQAQIQDSLQINYVKVIKVQRKPRVSTEIRTQWQLNEIHDTGLHLFAIKKKIGQLTKLERNLKSSWQEYTEVNLLILILMFALMVCWRMPYFVGF